jgi:hypothetical protein
MTPGPLAPSGRSASSPEETAMSQSEIKRLRAEMNRLPDYVRDEIVSQIHQLAGLIAFRDMEGVLKQIQDLSRIFEPNDE